MSNVPKGKRKETGFEVFVNLSKMRKEMTDLLLRDFGYSIKKAEKYTLSMYGGKPYEQLTDKQRENVEYRKARNSAFNEWFIIDERKAIVDYLRAINREVYVANSIYPLYGNEMIERRIHQDNAIGLCYALVQEFQYIIETLPVDVNKYLSFMDIIDKQIALLKGWRKRCGSKTVCDKLIWVDSESASNFCNVSNNGNANYNDASNSNSVRPDFYDNVDIMEYHSADISLSQKGESIHD